MKTSYVKTKFNNIINATEIVTIHYYEFDKTFNFVGEKHNFWEIVYVDNGSIKIMCDDKEVVLNQGEIIFHKPNEFHSVKSYNSSPNIFVISFVCKSSAMQYFERYKTKLNRDLKSFISSIITEANNTYKIPKNDVALNKLEVKDEAKFGGEQLIKTYLEQFLILLIRNMTEKNNITIFPAKENMEDYLTTEIKNYIKNHLYERIKVEDICTAFGYSKSYLSTIFKQQCGVSLAKYYNQLRVKRAKSLIQNDNKNFAEISDLLAFDNPQYFTRVFKRVTGLTPSEFKNSLHLESTNK